jgi:PAT family beta-lactamase induction signal transducer AmpG
VSGTVGRGGRLAVLAGLYLAQGLPDGFFRQALPVVLRDGGASLTWIGATGALSLPWTLKALWAPWIDRSGSRRRWVLAMQVLSVTTACVLSRLDVADPADLLPVVVGVGLLNLWGATQDIAADGLAVTLFPRAQHGLANGVQVAAYRAGMMLGGGVLLMVWGRAGWSLALVGLAMALAASAIPLLALPEVGAGRGGRPSTGGFAWDWLLQPGRLGWIALLVGWKVGDHVAQTLMRPWLVDGGVEAATLGAWMGLHGFGSGLVGALVGGAAVERFGAARALGPTAWLLVLGPLAWWVTVHFGLGVHAAWWAVVVDPWVGGVASAAWFAAMMDRCREAQAGTDYTVQASLVVAGSGLGSLLGGFLGDALGYDAAFGVATVLTVAFALAVHLVPRAEAS